MDGMETRELRYFVAVAEELHFGRAAQRLGIAQPPLSRAIQQLERRLGAALLDRTSRAVTLTEAGSVLLAEGRAALDAVDAAERRTRRAAPFRDRPSRPGPGHEGRRVQRTAGETARRVRRRTRRGPRRRHPVRPGRAGTTPARGPGRRGAAAPAVRLDGRVPHRRTQHGGPGRGPAGRAPAHRPRPCAHGRHHRRCRACPCHAGPTPTAPTRPAPARRSATTHSCCSSSRSAARARSHRSRAEPSCTMTSPPCPCWTRRAVTTVIAWPPHSRSRAVADLVRTATRL